MYTQRLRKLYVKQLEDTRQYLSGLLKQSRFLGADARRLALALSDKNVTSLVDALEEILSVFAMYGVARDFERLNTTKALFVKDKDRPTKTLPNGKEPILDLDRALDATQPFTGDASITKEVAYMRYFGT